MSASANYAIYSWLATPTTNFHNNLISYINDPLTNYITAISSTNTQQSTWPTAYGATNLFSLLTALNIPINDTTQSAYLKPAGASALTTGGASLTTATAGFTPSEGASAFAVDRNGRPRPTTGAWTIGAYEYN